LSSDADAVGEDIDADLSAQVVLVGDPGQIEPVVTERGIME
jgi:hypothetical protein